MGSKTHLFLVLLSVNLLYVSAEAEAEAEPQAEPEAQAEGNVYGMGGMGGMGMMQQPTAAYGASPYGASAYAPAPAPGQCGGVEECCDMVDQGCCVNQGQECFNTWEKECSNPNLPECKTRMVEKCETYPIKSCRNVQEIKSIPIPVEVCRVEKEQQCWPYTKKVCKTDEITTKTPFSWKNQELEVGEETKDMCKQVKKCNIIDDVVKQNKRVPEKVCKKVPRQRQVCTTVSVPQDPIKVPTTEWRIEYQQKCYQVPRPKCIVEPCTYQVEVQPVCQVCPGEGPNICPTCKRALEQAGGRYPVGGVVGGGGYGGVDMCGQCQQRNFKMCTKLTEKCITVMETVCQSVPIKIPVRGFKEVPQPDKQELQCNIVTEYFDDCRIEYRNKEIEVKIKRCVESMGQECVKYTIPTYNVKENDENQEADFKIPTCRIEEVPDQHCVALPTKKVCNTNQSDGKVRITKKVCDRVETKRICKQFPEEYCVNGGQTCKMVQKPVCQDKCQQTDYCNTCSVAIGRGDFQGVCPTCRRAYEQTTFG